MKSHRFTFPIASFAALLLGATTILADDSPLSTGDKSFLKNAYEDGLAEVKAAELGQSKTANEDVKALANRLVEDHNKANEELKTLSGNKKVTLAESPSLVDQAKDKLLDAKTGDNFDKAFADAMVKDHKKAIEAFEKAASEGQDPDVKAFAEKILPTLKMHLSMAQDLQDKIGK